MSRLVAVEITEHRKKVFLIETESGTYEEALENTTKGLRDGNIDMSLGSSEVCYTFRNVTTEYKEDCAV